MTARTLIETRTGVKSIIAYHGTNQPVQRFSREILPSAGSKKLIESTEPGLARLPSGTRIGSAEAAKAAGGIGPLFHYSRNPASVYREGFTFKFDRSQSDGIYFMDDPKELTGYLPGSAAPIQAYVLGPMAKISRYFVIPPERVEEVRAEFGTVDINDLIEPGSLGNFLRLLDYNSWTDDSGQVAALHPTAVIIVQP